MNTTQKKDLQRANELMRVYAQCDANKKALMATIANELKAYDENMAEAKAELLAIGDRNLALFEDDNLKLDGGYLHISMQSVIETTNKFSWADFLEEKGDLAKVDFEKAKVKKAWLDTEQHNELIALGVQVNTDRVMQVIVDKK